MPTAPSQVDMMTESIRVRFTLMPAARAKAALEPTAVIAVPVLVWRKAHIRKASNAKAIRDPVGILIRSSGPRPI